MTSELAKAGCIAKSADNLYTNLHSLEVSTEEDKIQFNQQQWKSERNPGGFGVNFRNFRRLLNRGFLCPPTLEHAQ